MLQNRFRVFPSPVACQPQIHLFGSSIITSFTFVCSVQFECVLFCAFLFGNKVFPRGSHWPRVTGNKKVESVQDFNSNRKWLHNLELTAHLTVPPPNGSFEMDQDEYRFSLLLLENGHTLFSHQPPAAEPAWE